MFCSTWSGSGRSIGMLFSVSSTSRMSCVLAPSIPTAKGMPLPSVKTDRLVPSLPRSVGFRPVFFPPERCLGHGPVHRLPFPFDPLQLVIFFQRGFPEFRERSSFDQNLKIRVSRAPRSKFRWQSLPLTAGSQDIKNPVQNGPPRRTRASTFLALPILGQQRFDPGEQLIRHPE